MPTIVDREPLTLALRAAIRSIPGMGCEIADIPPPPTDDDIAPELPYVVLYPIDSEFVGPPQALAADARFAYQTTLVCASGEQAEFNASRVRAKLLAFSASVAGMVVMDRSCLSAGGIDREGTLLNVHDRYAFDVTAV